MRYWVGKSSSLQSILKLSRYGIFRPNINGMWDTPPLQFQALSQQTQIMCLVKRKFRKQTWVLSQGMSPNWSRLAIRSSTFSASTSLRLKATANWPSCAMFLPMDGFSSYWSKQVKPDKFPHTRNDQLMRERMRGFLSWLILEGRFCSSLKAKSFNTLHTKANRIKEYVQCSIIISNTKTLFKHISKHPEANWKYDTQGSIFWRTLSCWMWVEQMS